MDGLDKGCRLPVADYIAFDLETSGLSWEKDEILEIALVRFKCGQVAERWSTLLKPQKEVPLKTLRLTGISPEELERSQVFSQETAGEIELFCGDLPLVGHNSVFDVSFLQKQMPSFPQARVYDTLELARIVFPGLKTYKLVDLAEFLGVSVTEAHRAYDDALVSGNIFRIIQNAAAGIPEVTKNRIISIMGGNWVAANLFMSTKEQAVPQPSLFGSEPKLLSDANPATVTEAFQSETSMRIMDMLSDSDNGVTLVNISDAPDCADAVVDGALWYSQAKGSRVLLLGFPDASLKGNVSHIAPPNDYLCLAKFREIMEQVSKGEFSKEDVNDLRFLASVARWVEITDTGAFSDIQVMTSVGVMKSLACPHDISCRVQCPWASDCFAVRAENSQKPVSCANYYKGLELQGGWDKVVVWNCHELLRVWQRKEPKVNLAELNSSAIKMFNGQAPESFSGLVQKAKDELRGTGCIASPQILELLSEARDELKKAGQVNEWVECLLLDTPGTVIMLEAGYGDQKNQPILSKKALWPGAQALSYIQNNLGQAVLMSPLADTLQGSVGFRYMFGLEEDTQKVSFRETAPTNVLFVAMDEHPLPKTHEYEGYVSRILQTLVNGQRKGVHALFPSRRVLRAVYQLCEGPIESQGVAVYGVGIDGGHAIIQQLGKDDAVVFSTTQFPGYLDPVPRCLVVTKVPFMPPNPLDELRKKELHGLCGNPFAEINLGQAVLALRAHVERLIDTKTRCAVVILDPKAVPGGSPWAADFWNWFSDISKVTCPGVIAMGRIAQWISGISTGQEEND